MLKKSKKGCDCSLKVPNSRKKVVIGWSSGTQYNTIAEIQRPLSHVEERERNDIVGNNHRFLRGLYSSLWRQPQISNHFPPSCPGQFGQIYGAPQGEGNGPESTRFLGRIHTCKLGTSCVDFKGMFGFKF